MNKRMLIRRTLFTSLAAAMVALSGCAAFAPLTPEQAVEKRALSYWKARIAGDYDKAYTLSTAAYRNVKSAQQFRAQFGAGANVLSAEVYKVTCEEQKCNARMKLTAKPIAIQLKLDTISLYLDEIWLLEDGQWWIHQDL